MLTQDQIDVLKAPFPEEALRADTSRGFELTSIRAAYVIERLNDVFGPCGIGWRYVHSLFQKMTTDSGYQEITTEVAFQYRLSTTNDCVGCDKECGMPRPTAGPSATVPPTRTGASPSWPVVGEDLVPEERRSRMPASRPSPMV